MQIRLTWQNLLDSGLPTTKTPLLLPYHGFPSLSQRLKSLLTSGILYFLAPSLYFHR